MLSSSTSPIDPSTTYMLLLGYFIQALEGAGQNGGAATDTFEVPAYHADATSKHLMAGEAAEGFAVEVLGQLPERARRSSAMATPLNLGPDPSR